MHKRERVFPFSPSIEDEKFFLKQVNFNYPNLDYIYTIVAKYYQLQSNELILTAGCDIALRTFYESLQSPEYLFLPNSCYAMNYVYKNIYHPDTKIKNYEFDFNGKVNVDQLILQISRSSGSKVVILESPSGFTGQGLIFLEFKKLLDYCESENITLVIDETYLETREDTWTAKKFINSKNLIIISSFSKAYGIAGLRAGIIIGNKLNIKTLSSLLPMHELTSFTAYLLEKVISDQSLSSFRSQIKEDENYIFDEIDNNNGFKVLKTETNFVLFRHESFSCNYIHDFLLKNNIKVKVHKSVPLFGEWCSASLGNLFNMNKLIDVLKKIN